MSREYVIGPMPFTKAEQALVNLQDHSGKFKMGGRPFIGDLKASKGYGKKIGLVSHDGKVRTRIDWDAEKKAHFNYEDFEHDYKVCIRISDWTEEDYLRHIEYLNRGIDENNVDMQFWRSRRQEGISVEGYLIKVRACGPEAFRQPTKLYKKAKTGRMLEEVVETKRVL